MLIISIYLKITTSDKNKTKQAGYTVEGCTNSVQYNISYITAVTGTEHKSKLTHWGWDSIFFNENVWISIEILLKFVLKGPINNIPALVPIMAWRRPGDKPLSEPMMVSLPTHICVPQHQWVKRHPITHLIIVDKDHSDVTWRLWDLKSPSFWLFVPQLVPGNNKWNIKALHYWPFVRRNH